VVELFEDFRDAVFLDYDNAARVRLLGLVPVAGIREIETAVRSKGQVVGAIEFDPVRLADQHLNFAVSRRLLDRGGTVDGRGPGADIGCLRRIDGAVRAEHARVGTAADEGIGRLRVGLRVPAADLAQIGVGEDYATVIEFIGPFRMA
jgi:hypothetical protein